MDYFFLTTSLIKIVALLAVVLGIMNYTVYAERRISARAASLSAVAIVVRTVGWLCSASATASASVFLMACWVSSSGQTDGVGTIEAAGAQIGHS